MKGKNQGHVHMWRGVGFYGTSGFNEDCCLLYCFSFEARALRRLLLEVQNVDKRSRTKL